MRTMFSGELYTTPHHTVCLVSSIVVARVIPCKSWSDRATNKPFLIDWKQTEFEFKIIPRNDLNNKSIIDKNGNFFMIITGIRWDFRNNYGFNPKIQIYLSSLLPHFGKFWGCLTFLSESEFIDHFTIIFGIIPLAHLFNINCYKVRLSGHL